MNDFFNRLPPKTAFITGIVGGILSLCTIGFAVLLVLGFGGFITAWGAKSSEISGIVAAPTPLAPTPNVPSAPPPTGPVPPVTNADHIRGDKNAELTWVEYSDFECPFCKRFHPTMQQMIDEYKGKVAWVYRHFPLSFHANAQKEAEAAECANELGGNDAFWSYTDKIFERTTSNGTGFALNALVPLAQELGLNENKFKECLDSGKFAQHVIDELNAGAAAGVNGTPGSFLINQDGQAQLISGALPYEQIKTILNAQLK